MNSAMGLTSDAVKGYEDDPILNSPFALVSTLNIALAYMLWYITVTHWNMANYIAWVRLNPDLLQQTPDPKIYLAFVVLSELLLWGLGGPLFFYAAKYRKTNKDRNRMMFFGILTFLVLSDVPFFCMDLLIMYNYGFQSVVQTVTMVLRGISFFLSSTLTWQMYVHRAVKFLQLRYDDPEERAKLAVQQERAASRAAIGMRTENQKYLHSILS